MARLVRRRGLALRHPAGMFAGEVGMPRLLNLFDKYEHHGELVHPGPLDRDVSRLDQDDRRRGARDRRPRLLAREPGGDDAQAGGGRARQVRRVDREGVAARSRAATSRRGGRCPRSPPSCCSKYGFTYDHSQGYNDFDAVLRARRRRVDQDRLLQGGGGVDEAARPRQGDRPRRDRRELVPRRPAADDVHQGVAEQPRLREPARHRGDVARPVRLGLREHGLRGVPLTIHPTSAAGRRCC